MPPVPTTRTKLAWPTAERNGDLMAGSERDYLIRKNGYWYRPNSQGYTAHIRDAGHFTYMEAHTATHPNGADGPRDGMSFMKVKRAIKKFGTLRDRVPDMPPTIDRRPYDEEVYPGYLESDNDWASHNWEAVRWLIENHKAIRAALTA